MKTKSLSIILIAFLSAASLGCERIASAIGEQKVAEADQPQTERDILADAVNGSHRSDDERARDEWRHPRETLEFFQYDPSLTVLEVWPGRGWYTNILTNAATAGDGMVVAGTVPGDASDRARQLLETFETRFSNEIETGRLIVVPLANAADVDQNIDIILTFRNAHNWISRGNADEVFTGFYETLKPGGVLGVVDHRADEEKEDGVSHGGYVTEASVIAIAENAGFIFEEGAEINANPKDDRDHPFGVWTLAPTRRSAVAPGKERADFPREEYDAIGESDRMTLRFRKPISAPPTSESE